MTYLGLRRPICWPLRVWSVNGSLSVGTGDTFRVHRIGRRWRRVRSASRQRARECAFCVVPGFAVRENSSAPSTVLLDADSLIGDNPAPCTRAEVAELADAPDSGSGALTGCPGSNPGFGTNPAFLSQVVSRRCRDAARLPSLTRPHGLRNLSGIQQP